MSKHGVTGPAGAALAAIELERRKPRPTISAARVREIAVQHTTDAYGIPLANLENVQAAMRHVLREAGVEVKGE